jgi:hypothetical protein
LQENWICHNSKLSISFTPSPLLSRIMFGVVLWPNIVLKLRTNYVHFDCVHHNPQCFIILGFTQLDTQSEIHNAATSFPPFDIAATCTQHCMFGETLSGPLHGMIFVTLVSNVIFMFKIIDMNGDSWAVIQDYYGLLSYFIVFSLPLSFMCQAIVSNIIY